MGHLERQRRGGHALPDASPDDGERRDVAQVETVELVVDGLVQGRLHEMQAEGGGRDGEAIRHPNARRREGRHQLAQRGVLASDLRDVVHADLMKRQDVAGRESAGSDAGMLMQGTYHESLRAE